MMKRGSCLLAAMLLAALGCGGSETDSYKLVPVTGTLTLDGKPMEGATITFLPEAGNKPSTAGGDLTGTGGTFNAKYRNRVGLAPGKYKVVISKPKADSAASANISPDMQDDPYMMGLGGHAKDEAPPAYSDGLKTPLSIEVSDSGEKDVTFELKSAAK